DRSRTAAVMLGGALAAPAIGDSSVEPLAALYGRWIDPTTLARAVIAGLSNELDLAEEWHGVELLGHAESSGDLFSSTETIAGKATPGDRIRDFQAEGWLGLGIRRHTAPGEIDNDLRVQAFYHAGVLVTRRTKDTDDATVALPPDTLVHGVRLRFRWDALERN